MSLYFLNGQNPHEVAIPLLAKGETYLLPQQMPQKKRSKKSLCCCAIATTCCWFLLLVILFGATALMGYFYLDDQCRHLIDETRNFTIGNTTGVVMYLQNDAQIFTSDDYQELVISVSISRPRDLEGEYRPVFQTIGPDTFFVDTQSSTPYGIDFCGSKSTKVYVPTHQVKSLTIFTEHDLELSGQGLKSLVLSSAMQSLPMWSEWSSIKFHNFSVVESITVNVTHASVNGEITIPAEFSNDLQFSANYVWLKLGMFIGNWEIRGDPIKIEKPTYGYMDVMVNSTEYAKGVILANSTHPSTLNVNAKYDASIRFHTSIEAAI